MTAKREALEAICACYPKNSNAHRIARQALTNPATGDDDDDDALREAIKQALAHRYGDWTTILENALASSPAEPDEPTEAWQTEWPLGMAVEKKSGSSWHGKIVGYYSTALTPQGIAVESDREVGSVQIYPTKAMSQRKAKPDAAR